MCGREGEEGRECRRPTCHVGADDGPHSVARLAGWSQHQSGSTHNGTGVEEWGKHLTTAGALTSSLPASSVGRSSPVCAVIVPRVLVVLGHEVPHLIRLLHQPGGLHTRLLHTHTPAPTNWPYRRRMDTELGLILTCFVNLSSRAITCVC